MTDCPPRLRGDLSKWLQEINTGVYVGNVSGRVRDAIWDRVCENLRNGRATMVFSANNEQRMDFRVHNSAWVPVDYEGLQLIRRPLPRPAETEPSVRPGFSKAAKRQIAERRQRFSKSEDDAFVIIDLETTGLRPAQDKILEFGAVRVHNGKITETFTRLVQQEGGIPSEITALTGIDESLAAQEGVPLRSALPEFLDFISRDTLVGYNLSFDMAFLREACTRCGIHPPANRCVDLLSLARRQVFEVSDFKLETLVKHFSLEAPAPHRALRDCQVLFDLQKKLKEN